jgi:Transglutaminase-like superfamily
VAVPTLVLSRSGVGRFGRRIARAWRIPPRELVTTLHVVAVLGVVELLVRSVPLPRLSRFLGLRLNLAPARQNVQPLLETALPVRAQRQLRCAHRVADVWPFSKGPCLRRSLVVGHLLRQYDPAVRLGLAGSGDALVAHAWIEIDGCPLESVIDFEVFEQVGAAP